MAVNKKSFTLNLKESKSFSLFINGFQYVLLSLVKIKIIFGITSALSAILSNSITINGKKISVVTSIAQLIQSITQTIDLKKISLTAILSEIGQLFVTITLKTPISILSSTIEKLTLTLSARTITLVTTTIVATFYNLGFYDPDTLGDWDAETLGTMDYVTP